MGDVIKGIRQEHEMTGTIGYLLGSFVPDVIVARSAALAGV